MDGCRKRSQDLMRYLDREMDSREAGEFDRHLEACRECARAVDRNRVLEAWLKETSLAPLGQASLEEFLDGVRARTLQASGRRAAAAFHRAYAVLAAAAAILFLLWVFHAGEVSKEMPGRDPGTSGEVAEGIGPASGSEGPEPMVSEAERRDARGELAMILDGISDASGPELAALFDEAASSLRDRGWRVEVMLARALKHEEGERLRNALRLLQVHPDLRGVPGTASTVSGLLKNGRFPEDAMRALAALGGSRAEEALGKALLDEARQDLALELLSTLPDEGAAPQITKALLEREDRHRGDLSPFTRRALAALSRMGPKGVEGILAVFDESNFNPAVVDAFAPPDPGFAKNLLNQLDDRRGSGLQPGMVLAASLRLEEVLPLLRRRADRSGGGAEYPSLMATVGGPEAVNQLLDMYQGPVSLRTRKNLCLALAEVFMNHPAELDSTLETILDLESFSPESREVLVEMLSSAAIPASCAALSWMIENRPGMASQAALGLARTGSQAALTSLMEVLDREELSPAARTAAGAAAYHLGGDEVLQKIFDGQKEGGRPASKKPFPLMGAAGSDRRGALTEVRFQKLQSLIARYSGLPEQ